tara:strand:+ start:4995 stop:5255 length:261 start_codon:yes stop_codon:yes gene_type:complete
MTYHSKGYDEQFGSYKTVSKIKTPEYYNGKNGYTAREVVENFDLNYNLGTACTYILRAYRKHKTPNECLKKAIDHLKFELEKLQKE